MRSDVRPRVFRTPSPSFPRWAYFHISRNMHLLMTQSSNISADGLAGEGLHVLTYVQYMAQTAQSEAAKRIFASFVKQERQRLDQYAGIQSMAMPTTRDATNPRATPIRKKGAS